MSSTSPEPNPKKNLIKGFTLIELLIVVAIIAILAAIAIPNFLMAQTRSKVSRVKADMRSLATAIESYQLDNNYYPIGFGYPEGWVRYRLARITTPIAYMTSLPGDPFTPLNIGGGPAGDVASFVYLLSYYHQFDYYYATDPQFQLAVESPYIKWVLVSQGPGRYTNSNYIIWTPYDPTNGTISEGRIVRSGP